MVLFEHIRKKRVVSYFFVLRTIFHIFTLFFHTNFFAQSLHQKKQKKKHIVFVSMNVLFHLYDVMQLKVKLQIVSK